MAERELPVVTVIMPVRNEAVYIRRAVESVVNQDYPSHLLNVLVFDGRSSDATRTIVSYLVRSYGSRITLSDNPRRTVPFAMNRGLELATGEVVIRLDGHCSLPPNYVSTCVQRLLSGDADAVGGRVMAEGEGILPQTIAWAMSSRFGVGASSFRVGGEERFVNTIAFAAHWKEQLQGVGRFFEYLRRNSDDEFNFRFREAGYSILMIPRLSITYWSRASLLHLAKQFLQYGFYKLPVLLRHPKYVSARHLLPVVFIALGIAVVILLIFAPFWGFLLLIPYILYLAGLFAYSLLSRSARSFKHRLLFPVVVLAMHVSYGLGFFWSVICLPFNIREIKRMLFAGNGKPKKDKK